MPKEYYDRKPAKLTAISNKHLPPGTLIVSPDLYEWLKQACKENLFFTLEKEDNGVLSFINNPDKT